MIQILHCNPQGPISQKGLSLDLDLNLRLLSLIHAKSVV